jgi:CRP-like cAMP-binding protein
MFIKEADLFRGVSQRTVGEIGSGSIEETLKAGDVLFRESERSEAFYVLVEGSVEISVGEKEVVNFVVERPGEVFGWSALVEPYLRTGTATCITDVRVVKVPREVMERIMKKHPEDGFIIMRHLTGIIAQRLRTAYQAASSEVDLMTAAHAPSYG